MTNRHNASAGEENVFRCRACYANSFRQQPLKLSLKFLVVHVVIGNGEFRLKVFLRLIGRSALHHPYHAPMFK